MSVNLRSQVLATLILGTAVFPTAQANTYVVPDPTIKWGTWEGWGTSLCWWANAYGDRDDLADLIFTRKILDWNGEPVPGLGLNIARYNAGASGSNTVNGKQMVASPRLSKGRQIQGFWLNPKSEDVHSDSWDWTLDAKQRAMLLKAKTRGADIFELFSNSPMWWMCANLNPSGAANAEADNLMPDQYRRHAIYLASIAKVARDSWGIDFRTVEPFNEPKTAYWSATGNQEGCHFETTTQAKVIAALRKELDRQGLGQTKIAASDETAYNQATATWSSFDRRTRSQIDQINVHGYQEFGKRDLLRSAVGSKPMWNSEYGEDDGTGKSLATNLNLDFQLLHPRAWLYWQAVDSGGWGLLANSRNGSLRINSKCYVLAQYTRHIRPGMEIVESGDMNTVVAYDPKLKRLVIVATNNGEAQKAFYYLNRFDRVAGPATRWTTAFSTADRYVRRTDVLLKDKVVSADLPAGSVQTIEIENVTLRIQ